MPFNLDLLTTFGFYTAILAAIYLYLSIHVILIRAHKKIIIGDNNDSLLKRAIRAHSNFSEYVPIAIIMIFVVSQLTVPMAISKVKPMSGLTHLLFLLLILARVCHAYGMLVQEAMRKPKLYMRQVGMFLTFSVIGLAGLVLILNWIYSLALQFN